MELGVGSHPGPGIYAYYLRPCCAVLATTSPSTTHLQAHRRCLCHVMTGDGSSSWNSPPLIQPLCARDCHDSSSPRTTPNYRTRGHESYRPSLQVFLMTIPASQFSWVDTLVNPTH
ncbi:UNVERIFIED_CONTAM: hypothetical protein Slati_4402300 [Sesamum latifolium]|uniref:Uncharacterized protein n=1 Tax=Sesamum latifolium TaxID=2727402 RepID=A0AAW2SS61_9LAMI